MGAKLAEIEALYRTSYPRYRNAMATVTGSYGTARDAVQQAFAQAIAERARFRGEGSLSASSRLVPLGQSGESKYVDHLANGMTRITYVRWAMPIHAVF
jgi:hypothetical protein